MGKNSKNGKKRYKSSPDQFPGYKKHCQQKLTDYLMRANTDSSNMEEGGEKETRKQEMCSTDKEKDKEEHRDDSINISNKDNTSDIQEGTSPESSKEPSNSKAHREPTSMGTVDLRNVLEMLGQILNTQETLQKTVTNIETQIIKQREQQRNIVMNIETISMSQESMKQQITHLEIKLNDLERKQRERNIRLIGFPEKRNEDCYDILYNICHQMNVNPNIEAAHRTGKRHIGNRPRHMIFRVQNIEDKYRILRYQKYIQDREFFFVEDLTKMDYETKNLLKPQIDTAKQQGKRWQFRNGTLFIDGRRIPPPQSTSNHHGNQNGNQLPVQQERERNQSVLPVIPPRFQTQPPQQQTRMSATHKYAQRPWQDQSNIAMRHIQSNGTSMTATDHQDSSMQLNGITSLQQNKVQPNQQIVTAEVHYELYQLPPQLQNQSSPVLSNLSTSTPVNPRLQYDSNNTPITYAADQQYQHMQYHPQPTAPTCTVQHPISESPTTPTQQNRASMHTPLLSPQLSQMSSSVTFAADPQSQHAHYHNEQPTAPTPTAHLIHESSTIPTHQNQATLQTPVPSPQLSQMSPST